MSGKKRETRNSSSRLNTSVDNQSNSLLKMTNSSALTENLLGASYGPLNTSGRCSTGKKKSLPYNSDSQETNDGDKLEEDISKDDEIEELKLDKVGKKTSLARNIMRVDPKFKNVIPAHELSQEELQAHYTQCIGLFSKNKVNTKNAFKLQLIDFMKLMMDRKTDKSENLTLMSCTLDASAKIYSCRVDNVYINIQKFVKHCQTGNKDKGNDKKADESLNDGSGDESSSGEGDGQLGKADTKKKIKKKISKDLKKNFNRDPESLNRKEIEMCFYRQNLPRNQTYFLESSVLDDGHQLAPNRPLFPTSTPNSQNYTATFPIDKVWKGDMDTDNFEDKIPGYKELRSKLFIVDDGPEDESNCEMENEYTFDPAIEDIAEMKTFNEICDSQSEQGDENNVEDVEVDYDDCEIPANDSNGCDQTVVDNRISLPNSNAPTPRFAFTPVAMSKMLRSSSSKQSDYSYFDSSKLDFMPSATHWKIKPSKRSITAVGKTPGKTRKVKSYIDFLSEDQIILSATLLEDNTISHKFHVKTIRDWYNKMSDLIFMPIIPNVRKRILSLFKDPNCSFLTLLKSSESDSDNFNANESVLLNPSEFTSLDHQDDDDDDHDNGAGEGDYHPLEDWRETDCPEPAVMVPDNDPIQENEHNQNLSKLLVPAPNRVEKVSVKYAKTQKRIDIKKLKCAIWNLLDLENKSSENKENEKDLESQERIKKEIKFSEVFKPLPDKISKEAAAELSYPIAFMAILHMANEKTLRLTPTDNFQRDFTVSLDFPPNTS